MALTRNFKELVQKRVASDPAFGAALLREGIDAMLAGDVDAGKAILRDYIKATVGFEKLGQATGTPAKSLIRMFGPRGNPQARNLFGIIGYLQKQAASKAARRGRAGVTTDVPVAALTALLPQAEIAPRDAPASRNGSDQRRACAGARLESRRVRLDDRSGFRGDRRGELVDAESDPRARRARQGKGKGRLVSCKDWTAQCYTYRIRVEGGERPDQKADNHGRGRCL